MIQNYNKIVQLIYFNKKITELVNCLLEHNSQRYNDFILSILLFQP